MKSKTFPILALFIVSAATAQISSQNDLEIHSFDFRAISWDGAIRDIFYQSFDQKPQAVTVPTGGRSAMYHYSGPSPLVFFRDGGLDAEGNPIKIPVASFPIQPGARETLLNFFRDPSNPERFRLLPIQEDLESFPFNTCLFYNFSGRDLIVKIGDSADRIPARASRRFDFPKGDSPNFLVQIADRREGEWDPLYSSVWGASQGIRLLTLAVADPSLAQTIDIKMLRENERAYQYSRDTIKGMPAENASQ